jgi:hypothetical protein
MSGNIIELDELRSHNALGVADVEERQIKGSFSGQQVGPRLHDLEA